jgi:hypothetical protein
LFASWFYKVEVVEVSGPLTAILVTYHGVCDHQREIGLELSWKDFLARMAIVKSDWMRFERSLIDRLRDNHDKVICGWKGRTIYIIKDGQHSEQ